MSLYPIDQHVRRNWTSKSDLFDVCFVHTSNRCTPPRLAPTHASSLWLPSVLFLCDPLTDKWRAVPQLLAIRLALAQEAHRLSIDKFHVFEIQNNSLDFFHFSFQLLHMFRLHSSAQPQNNSFPVCASVDFQHHFGELLPGANKSTVQGRCQL